MLVKRAFETEGIVEICETVSTASKEYRMGQDYISLYLNERIVRTTNQEDKIGKRFLVEDFKTWFQAAAPTKKLPKGEELTDLMVKRFGPCKKKGWTHVKFANDDDDDADVLNEI